MGACSQGSLLLMKQLKGARSAQFSLVHVCCHAMMLSRRACAHVVQTSTRIQSRASRLV